MKDDKDMIGDKDYFIDGLENDLKVEQKIMYEETHRKQIVKILLISVLGILAVLVVYFVDKKEELAGQAIIANTKSKPKKNRLLANAEIEKMELTVTKKNGAVLSKAVLKSPSPTKPKPEQKTDIPASPVKQPSVAEPPVTPKVKVIKKAAPIEKETLVKKHKSAEPSKMVETDSSGKYFIQLGTFVMRQNAEELMQSLRDHGFSPSNMTIKSKAKAYRVFIGAFDTQSNAEDNLERLLNEGIDTTLISDGKDKYTLLAGSFFVKKNADELIKKVNNLGISCKKIRETVTLNMHKVFVGFFKSRKNAELYRKKMGKNFSDSFVTSK